MKPCFMFPLVLAGPALGGEIPVLHGADCPVILTVQSQDCTVSHVRHCAGEALGATTTVTYDSDGYMTTSVADAQGGWVESYAVWDQAIERTLPDPADPVSLDDLLADMVDTYDFRMTHAAGGVSRTLRVIGADLLTGREVTIDGVKLREVSTDLRILEEDGAVHYQTRGMQYVSPEMRLWFLGTDAVQESDGSITNYDSRPVTFRFPGDPGFATTVPKFGCIAAPGK